MTVHRLGWRPDTPDQRDLAYEPAGGALPQLVDLRKLCPPVYDQGQLGSCTGNAIAGALQYLEMKEGKDSLTPSRLFIYYNERALEGTVASDAGAEIRDGIKSVVKLGDCHEYLWPYDPAKFADKPSPEVYAAAAKGKVKQYLRVAQDLGHMADCLAAGFPFVFGFTVYESFESDAVASSGIVSMPAKSERTLGGHAVLCVGYDEDAQRFIIRNSWGSDWGQAGYCTMPFAYLASKKLASDFWTLRAV